MAKLPVRRQQFKTAEFAAWLAKYGAELGVPTNPYEVIRYRAYDGSKQAVTHIVYAKESGLLTWTGGSQAHYVQFVTGAAMWSPKDYPVAAKKLMTEPGGGPARVSPTSKMAKVRAAIRKRDGEGCWFCGKDLGSDATIEHLVPKSEGGRNTLHNYALAHKRCNNLAADMPLVKKIELRANLRSTPTNPLPGVTEAEGR